MKQEVLIGQTDYTVLVLIRDDAGAPKTGLTEASVDIAYARVETDNDVTTADVTPAALSALTDAHTDWGFEEVSATDHPGLYRLDIADAVFASGAWTAVVSVVGTGLDPTSIEFVLVAFNPRDGVRLGLTALPNAAADAAGGLPISDAGGLDLDAQIGTDIDAILVDTGTTLQGELDAIEAAVITNAAGTDVAADIIALKAVADAILVDTGTTLDGRIPAALVSGRMDSSVGAFASGQGPRIRKNVALSNFMFLMTDSTNHAPATGKTVSVTRSIDGAAFAAGTLGSVTEVSAGWYKVDFGAGDLNGDVIAFRATATSCDDLDITIITNP